MNEKWIDRKIKFYSKKMGIPLPNRTLYHEKDYAYHVETNYQDYAYAQRITNHEILGSNYRKGETVFINLDLPSTESQFEDTVVHELVHTKYKNMVHSPKFYRFVSEIKKGNYNPKYGRWEAFKDWVGPP